MTQPLDDILVLDFSTLLPGPMATLMLAEAGAEVIKLERPGSGEDMRLTEPMIEGRSLGYAILNRGKKSIALDLKAEGAVASLRSLIEKADVIVEQFRPGVMERLGLGYDAVRTLNSKIIYCSITGYGQSGPKRDVAGHDMNYVGDAGVLSLSSGSVDSPTAPFGLIADIGGGTYPAIMNILLALRQRDTERPKPTAVGEALHCPPKLHHERVHRRDHPGLALEQFGPPRAGVALLLHLDVPRRHLQDALQQHARRLLEQGFQALRFEVRGGLGHGRDLAAAHGCRPFGQGRLAVRSEDALLLLKALAQQLADSMA